MKTSGALLEMRKSKTHCCREPAGERCFIGDMVLANDGEDGASAETRALCYEVALLKASSLLTSL
jgi:hypothetical protein